MSKTNYPGIDYSGPRSTANRDSETGIRYGIISQRSLNGDIADDIGGNDWQDIGLERAVEEAKSALVKSLDTDDPKESLRSAIEDYVRKDRIGQRVTDILNLNDDPRFIHRDQAWAIVSEDFSDAMSMGDCFGPWRMEDGLLVVQTVSDQNELWVFKSAFYTYAQFCSPCFPGACNLDSPLELPLIPRHEPPTMHTQYPQNKCYCLPHDWFEHSIAPYPVWRVADDVQIVAELKSVPCPYCTDGRRPMSTMAEARNITVDELIAQIVNKTFEPAHMVQGFDLKERTFLCLYCQGSGTKQETVESEVAP